MRRVMEAGHDQVLERSRKMVEAAYELLAEGGLEGLTIRAILGKTGLSRRTFYERFEGKDDLVLAVFEETIRQAAHSFGEHVKAYSDPLERLHRIVTLIVLGHSGTAGMNESSARAGSRRSIALSREHLRMAESRPQDLQIALRPLIELIAEQLAAGMALGKVRCSDPARLATLVYNLVATTVHTELLEQGDVAPNHERRMQLAEELWIFCRRAIAAEGGAGDLAAGVQC